MLAMFDFSGILSGFGSFDELLSRDSIVAEPVVLEEAPTQVKVLFFTARTSSQIYQDLETARKDLYILYRNQDHEISEKHDPVYVPDAIEQLIRGTWNAAEMKKRRNESRIVGPSEAVTAAFEELRGKVAKFEFEYRHAKAQELNTVIYTKLVNASMPTAASS